MQAIPPPLPTPPVSLPQKMYRFNYYVLFHDGDKNSPTKSNEVYELCDPTINLSILLQTTQMSVVHTKLSNEIRKRLCAG